MTAAVLLSTALSLTACGSSRPSVDEIQAKISKAGGDKVTDSQARCLAKTYYDSDLSDDAVKLLVDAKDVTDVKPDDLSKKDQAASKKLYKPLVACLQSGS